MLVVATVLAIVLGAVLTFLSGSSGSEAQVHAAGLVIMLAGLAVLVSMLIRAVIGLRRTGRHRRSGLVARSAPDRSAPDRSEPRIQPWNPPSSVRREPGPARRRTNDLGPGYSGSHASPTYEEPAARRDTSARW